MSEEHARRTTNAKQTIDDSILMLAFCNVRCGCPDIQPQHEQEQDANMHKR